MGAKTKAFIVLLAHVVVIVGVYALTLWKYHEHFGKPSWTTKKLAPLYGCLAAVAGIVGLSIIKFTFYYFCYEKLSKKWKPSVILYLTLCALPCNIIVVCSHLQKGSTHLEDIANVLGVFQAIVAGLMLTEWIAKFRFEKLTYQLVEDAAIDFFFAYDVFDFYDRFFEKEATRDHNTWLIVTVFFAFIAMIKYCPQRPIDMEDCSSYSQAVIYILFGLFCNDLPFVVIRFISMGMYGLEVVDVIHPAKNTGLIFFGLLQIWLLRKNCSGANCIRRCQRDYLYPV